MAAARVATAAVAAIALSACQSTTIAGLNVRTRPSTASPAAASLGDAGTAVVIDCFTRGEPVHGDTVWYRISRPSRGYVSNYYIRTDGDALGSSHSC